MSHPPGGTHRGNSARPGRSSALAALRSNPLGQSATRLHPAIATRATPATNIATHEPTSKPAA